MEDENVLSYGNSVIVKTQVVWDELCVHLCIEISGSKGNTLLLHAGGCVLSKMN